MSSPFQKFSDSSSATKGFVATLATVGLILLVTTVFAYCRLNSARSYDTTSTEQVGN